MTRLEEIRARCEAASSPPWVWIETDCGSYGPKRKDAEFISHSREDVPWLLEQIDVLIKTGTALHMLN